MGKTNKVVVINLCFVVPPVYRGGSLWQNGLLLFYFMNQEVSP